jgi:hypothetical protein
MHTALFSVCCILVLIATIESSGKDLQAGMWKVHNATNLKVCHFVENAVACYKDVSMDSSACSKCGTQFQHCHIDIQPNETVMISSCVTRDKDTNLTEVGKCIYVGTREVNRSSIDLTSLCTSEFHRTGTLCGKCKDGYYPLVYSFDMYCIQCPNGGLNWWKFVLAAFLPLTIFFFLVLFLKINVTLSVLHGYVFLAQTLSTPGILRLMLTSTKGDYPSTAFRYLMSLHTIWNLDFFRAVIPEICLGTDTLQTLALDFVIGLYPLLLLVLTYVMIHLHDREFKLLVAIWRPFHRLLHLISDNWEIRTSIVDVFATFLLLAYCKILNTAFDLLAPIRVHQLHSSQHLSCTWRLYFDATIPYFGAKHLPYAILAIVMLILFGILPLLLLCLYPFSWFQKLLNLFPLRWYILHTFMDSFQGCYKDGTEPGTRDCRWFAGVFLFIRLVLILIAALTLGVMFYVYSTITLAIVIIMLISIRPYKEHLHHHMYTNAIFLLLLALWNVACIGKVYAQQFQKMKGYIVLIGIFLILPLLFISAIAIHWMHRKRKFGSRLISRIDAWRQGYRLLH